eukprot:scaffold88469_cov31-Prasinocladus_malaysianus.AAC.1
MDFDFLAIDLSILFLQHVSGGCWQTLRSEILISFDGLTNGRQHDIPKLENTPQFIDSLKRGASYYWMYVLPRRLRLRLSYLTALGTSSSPPINSK